MYVILQREETGERIDVELKEDATLEDVFRAAGDMVTLTVCCGGEERVYEEEEHSCVEVRNIGLSAGDIITARLSPSIVINRLLEGNGGLHEYQGWASLPTVVAAAASGLPSLPLSSFSESLRSIACNEHCPDPLYLKFSESEWTNSYQIVGSILDGTLCGPKSIVLDLYHAHVQLDTIDVVFGGAQICGVKHLKLGLPSYVLCDAVCETLGNLVGKVQYKSLSLDLSFNSISDVGVGILFSRFSEENLKLEAFNLNLSSQTHLTDKTPLLIKEVFTERVTQSRRVFKRLRLSEIPKVLATMSLCFDDNMLLGNEGVETLLSLVVDPDLGGCFTERFELSLAGLRMDGDGLTQFIENFAQIKTKNVSLDVCRSGVCDSSVIALLEVLALKRPETLESFTLKAERCLLTSAIVKPLLALIKVDTDHPISIVLCFKGNRVDGKGLGEIAENMLEVATASSRLSLSVDLSVNWFTPVEARLVAKNTSKFGSNTRFDLIF